MGEDNIKSEISSAKIIKNKVKKSKNKVIKSDDNSVKTNVNSDKVKNKSKKANKGKDKSNKQKGNKGKGQPKKKIKVFTNKKKKNEPEQIFIQKLQERYETIDMAAINTFTDLPISPKTIKGLKECGYTIPTDIQRETIKLSLQGKDILGAAQTGSGKTLAFLIPILEALFCKQWTRLDGLGGLVITPTRELAYQIFETLRKIGEHHDFSAGLIIGGKDLKFERNRMDQCNIIICTPGRLLQHMDENPLFDAVNMQILVLDEADRCLDMGFAETMNAIIANLPEERQTLLFSATQTKSVKDLARLSLKDPCYVSVHENKEHSTPSNLQQSYVICELQDKVSILYSFIKNHLKQKCIIFLSSCKQVKYMYEIFCKLRPGTSLLALYGTLHQLRRMDIYETFCRKQCAVLFATDIASRGLDFPEVHWVVQADCPEDGATYIHRVGRTARYHRGGESLLLLLPSEEAMVSELLEKKIPVNKIDINPERLRDPVRKMEAFLAKDPTLKDTAQRAFKSYAKSVFLMKNKKVFQVQKLDTDSYAKSLGLAIPPRIRFLQRMATAQNTPKIIENKNKTYFKDSDEDDDVPPSALTSDSNKLEKHESNDSGVSDDEEESKSNPFHVNADSDSDDGMLNIKRKDHDIELPTEEDMIHLDLGRGGRKNKKPITKAALVKKMINKKIVPNKKITFDDEGTQIVQVTKEKRSEMAQQYEKEDEGGINIETARLILMEEDKFDKQLFKEKVKAKHREEKRKLKEKKKADQEEKDDFGTDSDDGDAPDLSWMPDPDKIYGKQTEEEEANNPEFYGKNPDSDNDDVSGDEEIKVATKKPSKKRKLKSKKTEEKTVKKKKQKLENIGASLSVNEAEELAMLLLQSK